MNDQDRQGAAPVAGDLSIDRLRPILDLASGNELPYLSPTQRRYLRRQSAAQIGPPEVRSEHGAALWRLRQEALDLAQGAADAVLLLDVEIAAVSSRLREAAAALSREASRPLYERMLLAGLWAKAPELPTAVLREQKVRLRREARERRARPRG